MEREFSLSQYLAILRRRWRIVALTLAATLLAAVAFSLVQPVSYEGQAVLTAQPPKYAPRLDVSFQTVVEDLRLDRRAEYNALISDKTIGKQLAQTVIATLGDDLPTALRDPKQLRREVSVRNGQGRLVYLRASAATAELAQALTNAWAEAWIAVIDAQYGQSADRVRFEKELELAQARLDAATRALREFQARTGLGLEFGGDLAALKEGTLAAAMPLLQQELVLNNSALADYELALSRIHLLQDRARAAQAAGTPFSSLPLETINAPLLVQRGSLTRQRVDAMSGDFGQLLQALSVEEKSLAETAERLRRETNAIQTELAAQIQDRNRLYREYSLSEEAVRALQRKVTEIPIQQQVVGPPLMLLQGANLPEERATPNWLLNLVAASALGALGGIMLALVVEFAQESRAPERNAR
jgi:uncharacterized protein involved in exopolysaccharide biosynthesis